MYQNIYFDIRTKKVHLWDDTTGYESFKFKPYAYKKSSAGTYTSLFGDKLKKVYDYDPKEKGLFESDVPAETRVLVDRYADSDDISKNHRILFFDIEVKVTEGFPSPDEAPNEVTSIGFNDCTDDSYHCLVLDPEGKVDLNHPEILRNNFNVEIFDSEFDLLQRFFARYREINPTIISGWNSEKFDVPYIYNRACKIVGKKVASMLSPINVVQWSKFKEKHKIAGVSHLDYLFLYRKFTYTEKSSYRLDAIAEEELGENKVAYEGTLNDLYNNDRTNFVLYNVQDVAIVKRLNDKLDFISITQALTHSGHVPYENVFTSSRYLEGAILVYLRKLGIVAPDKKPKPKLADDFQFAGAHVAVPQKGKHDWVFDLDVTSMYPSVIMSLNISPETKLGKLPDWDSQDFIREVEKVYRINDDYGNEIASMSYEDFNSYVIENNISISANGVLYRTDKTGLIPAILSKWFDERVEYRKLAKKFGNDGNTERYEYFDRRQLIQKIMLNSLYGVLGLSVFRFYDIDNAEATTLTGQALIKFSKTITNHFYNNELGTDDDHVIYIDTDSIFASALPLVKHRYPNINVNSETMMTKRIRDVASELQDYLNNSYDYFASKFCNIKNHKFEIKQEVIGVSGLFIAKKRYGMKIINDNGVKVNKVMVKGIDTVRSNFPKACGKLLKEVLDDILANVPKEKIDERILKFKTSMHALPIDSFAMPTGIRSLSKYVQPKSLGQKFTTFNSGAPIHVKSAVNYNDLLLHFEVSKQYLYISSAEKIKWVYLTKNPLGIESLAYKGYEDPKEILQYIRDYIDYDKMYDKNLHRKIMMFYEAMAWSEPIDKNFTLERFF
jgi:DNA polymerase elongation subunit (family B)